MSGFLSKLGFSAANRINAADSSQNTVWTDENDPRIFYHLRPRARRISIKIDAARRQVIVAVPGTAKKLAEAQRFTASKWDWIAVQLEALPPPQPFVNGGHVLFRGELYTLQSPGGRGRAQICTESKTIIVPAPEGTLAGRAQRFLKKCAREDLTARTLVHAAALGRKVERISVRDTSSRWGSCVKGQGQKGGKISYSWRLVCAPPFVLDYVCAHECAHLVEANHGAGFWALCDELVDTVKPAKAWLNANGALLHAVGAPH